MKKRHSIDAGSVTSDEGGVAHAPGTPKRRLSAKKTLLSPEEQLRSRLWSIYKAVNEFKVSARARDRTGGLSTV